MKFAGDSMIVAFSPSNEEKAAADGGLKEATLRCMHCASDLVDKYGEYLPTRIPYIRVLLCSSIYSPRAYLKELIHAR